MYVVESDPQTGTLAVLPSFFCYIMARRTKKDALLTRSTLLDAAERLFQKRGVSRTSLADIARTAGVTRGAVYWHFKDKADLFDAMLERVTLPLEVDMDRVMKQEGDVLRAWCAHLRGVLHQIAHDARTRRVLQIAMQKVEHAEEMGPMVARHIALYRINLTQGCQILEQTAANRGRALPAPALELARSLHALLHGLIYGWLLDPCFDLEQTGANAMAFFLDGVGLAIASDEAAAPGQISHNQ